LRQAPDNKNKALATSQEENPMTLQENLQADLTIALKAKDAARISAIRVLIGEFQRQAEKRLNDDQVLAIIRKLIKSEKELLAHAGRSTSDFLTILEAYLPRMASEEEIRVWIETNIDFSTFGNRMQAMKPIMAHFGGRAEGGTVKKILESRG
jgi:uncharacterized protein YqeY